MAHYTELDAFVFETFLRNEGFVRGVINNEVLYVRNYKEDEHLKIKVYTSLGVGENIARDCGKDAIRVVALFDDGNKVFAVGKFPKILRTTSQESIHQRVLDRIADAEARCKEVVDKRKNPDGNYIGNVGDCCRLVLKVSDRKVWKDRYLFTMKDVNENIFTYWSARDVLKVGGKYNMSAKVLKHAIYNNTKQTVLVDCAGKEVV